MPVSELEELKHTILNMPESDYAHLRRWFFDEMDWQRWDSQLEADSEAGNLDFLVSEALKEKQDGALIRSVDESS